MAKVIGVDNFDRESVSDILIEENINDKLAIDLAKEMNDKASYKYNGNQPYYYRVVPDNYILYVFDPNN